MFLLDLSINFLLLVIFFAEILTASTGLDLGETKAQRTYKTHPDCTEVLGKNLDCPSVGAFAIAGTCDTFARCFKTEHGIEAEAEFCPDGQVYILNRCTINSGDQACPQKYCHLEKVLETSTRKTSKEHTTKKILFNLHPNKSKRSRPEKLLLLILVFPVFLLL